MSGMESLGRLLNIGFTMDGVFLNMSDAAAVTFVCHLAAGDTFTLAEATTLAGGGVQSLATITQFHTTPPAATSAWTKVTQAAAATVVTSSDVVAVFTVREEELSDGYRYLRVTSTSTGTVKAILHDLKVQRTPANLPAVSA